MGREHDELFAKHSIQLKLLTPAQVLDCREVLAELESAGITKTLAVVAVDQGVLSRPDARRLIDSINKKFPGRHPPLPESASPPPPPPARPAAEVAPRPARPAAARPAAPRKSAARPVPPPAPAGSRKTVLLVAASAVVVVAALAAFLLGGSRKPDAPEPSKKPELVRAPEPAPPPPPKKEEPKPEPKPAPPPPPEPKPKEDDGRKAFQERLAERKKEARTRLEEVLKEVAAQRKESEEAAAAKARRLAGKTVTVALLSGTVHPDAAVKSWNFNGVDLESGGKALRVTWEAVQPASLLLLADLFFDPQRPQDQFDRGRFFVARRMWKEAQDAFSAAAKFGQGFESRVLDFNESLERLVTGQGGFHGSARRVGRDGVRLSWDFRDATQLEDFTPGLTLAGRGAVLDAAKKTSVFFSGATAGAGEGALPFLGDLSAEMRLTSDGPVSVLLFSNEGGGYILELTPSGTSLVRAETLGSSKEARRTIATSNKVRFPVGKPCEVRLVVSFPRFRVTLDGAEALAAEDGPVVVTAEPPKGLFGLRIEKGRLRIEAPLALQGRAEAAELNRRISDTEVMLRRALDPDLEQIEKFRNRKKAMDLLGEVKDLSLSSDDPYFAFRIKKFEDITKYEELKKNLLTVDEKQAPDAWKKEIDDLLGKYPDAPSLYYVRALVRDEHHDLAGARADLRKALELFPEFHEALGLLGEILLQSADFQGSLAAATRAIEARPDYVQGYVLRARGVYITSFGSNKGFLEDLDIAQKLDPLDSEAVSVRRALTSQKVGPKDLGCRFNVETEHYRITSDISDEASKRYGENLEAAYRHYASSFKVSPTLGFLGKPRVAIFQTAENYYTYWELLSEDRGENTLGVFRPGLNELVLFESTDVAETNHVLYHEAVHHFMTLMTNTTPPFWYNEGIAEYMGSIRVEDGKVLEKALPLRSRLPYIQQAIDVGADVAFDKIMNESPREFYSGNSPLKYAQAWSMIHFFYEYEKGRYRPRIEKYFELLRQGRTPADCYDAVFRADEGTLRKEWREFTRKLRP